MKINKFSKKGRALREFLKQVSKNGFTLFEIIIVISIVLFLTILSVNLIIKNNSLYVNLEMERLYSLCLLQQRKAQIEQKTIKIIFDTNNRIYSVNSIQYKLCQCVKFGTIKHAQGPPSRPKNKIDKPITFTNNTMIFYPDGTISSGIIYFTDQNETVSYALSSGVASISYLRRYKLDKNWILIH